MHISADIAVAGAGVAGLWIARRLRADGYSVVVASDGTPGDGQTIASQGIVHSGLKYALGGSLTAASERIADMPDYWRACLRGETDIDLRATRVTSEQFYMMADASVTSRVTAFFGGQLTAGRSRSLSRADFPGTLRSGTFRGSVFEMSDFVLDARSLLETLGHGLTILEGRASPTVSDGAVTALQLSSGDTIEARHYVFAAGAGNEELIAAAGLPWATQRRPLCQVSVHAGDLSPLFAHSVSLRHGSKPRVTVTSHRDQDNTIVWYLGGNIAETGVKRTDEAQAAFARQELTALFPWIGGLKDATYRCHRIDRAEPAAKLQRPNEPACHTRANVTTCWPIKLTMAPMLANQVRAAVEALAPCRPQPDPTVSAVASPPWI